MRGSIYCAVTTQRSHTVDNMKNVILEYDHEANRPIKRSVIMDRQRRNSLSINFYL